MMAHPRVVSNVPRASGPQRRRRRLRVPGTAFGAVSRGRPRRPSNIRLIGRMQGSGFVEQPWLVQRDQHFIQVSKLLYRVAASANGRRTLDEIAAHLTKTTEWIVTPDVVRQIITTKLAPLGIVVMANSPDGAVVEKRPGSPLSVRMRTKLIGPSIIEPITTVLQVLFAPPILVAVLATIAIAHWWVYVEHGVIDGIRAALYTPGFLPLSLFMLVVANVLHEFGHAAALHYSGGRARSMGAGLYLVWPMLYTDVTESYRLGRGARMRTNLGGVYFHLIAALGVIGLYLITGHEYLLMVVLLISLEVLGQFVPFARLDGYWVIADLTGIPDFFSQMKPFLRSIVPGRRWHGSKLPPLKRWAKVVFATYITITVPVLALLLVLMLTNLPNIVQMTGDALLHQREEFAIAWMVGSIPMMIAIVVQVFFLLLQLVGVGLILYGVARVPLTVVRAALAARRWWLACTALGASAAVVLAVAFVWMP